MKDDRQRVIVRLITEQEIRTQEELKNALAQEGYVTTQATLSRDIRELHLKKKSMGPGKQKYVVSDGGIKGVQDQDSDSYRQIFSGGIQGITVAGNLIVVKTFSGMAMAVGAAIDNMNISGVAGCIAGDDTVFVAVIDVAEIDRIMSELREVN